MRTKNTAKTDPLVNEANRFCTCAYALICRVVQIANSANREVSKRGDSSQIVRRSIKSIIALNVNSDTSSAVETDQTCKFLHFTAEMG